MPKIWKDLKGYEGRYQVSSDGEVYSLIRGRVLRGGNNKDGYVKHILVNKYGKRKTELAHRLVALMFCEKPEGCNIVNHKNFKVDDNRSENLEWTTVAGNNLHSFQNGRRSIESQKRAAAAAKLVLYKNIEVWKDGEFIGVFTGKENCANKLGINPKTIYNGLNNRFGSRNGYCFREVGGANADKNQ